MDRLACRAEKFSACPSLAHGLRNRRRRVSEQHRQCRAGRELPAGSIVRGGAGHRLAIFEPVHKLLQFEVRVLREQRLGRARQAVRLHERMLFEVAPHAECLRADLVEREGQRDSRDTEDERGAEA